MLFLLASTVAGRPGRRAAARRCVGAVVGFLLLNWFFTPPVGTLTVAEPENAVGAGGVRRRGGGGRDRRRPGVPPRRRGRCAPAPRPRRWRAVPVGADRPGHRRGDRRAAARDVRPGRRLAAGAGPGGLDRAGVVRHRLARPRPTRATPGSGSTTTTCSRSAASRCAPATSGCSRRSPCRPGSCSSTAGCASATSGPRTSSAPRPPRPPCCAPSPTTCARRWPRCGPRSTGCVSLGGLRGGPRRSWSRAVDDSTRAARAAHRQPARPVPAADRLLHPVLRARSLDEVLPLALAGHDRRRVVGSRSTSRPRCAHRRRAARARGGQPGRQRGAARRRVAGPGARRTCCRTRSSVIVVDQGPGVPPDAAGADVRAVPAARRHAARRPGPRAGGRPRASPRRSAAPCPPRTRPAAG